MDAVQKEVTQSLGVLKALEDHTWRREQDPASSVVDPLPFLDWFATLFVEKDTEDVVAATMQANENSVTFYITNNQAVARPDIRNELQTTIHAAIVSGDPDEIYILFTCFIVRNCISRICRKINKLLELRPRANDPKYPSFDASILSAVDDWNIVVPGETFEAAESSPYGMPPRVGSDQLLSLVQQLTEWLKGEGRGLKASSLIVRQAAMERLWTLLRVLMYSGFITQTPYLEGSFEKFMLLVRRRLWHIFRYYHGITIFINVWLPHLRKLARPIPRIRWIQEVAVRQMPTEYHDRAFIGLDKDPRPFVKSLIRARFRDRSDDEIDSLIKDLEKVRKSLENPWSSSGRQRLRLHCEIQMATFLVEQGIEIYQGAVGVSKLCCHACDMWLQCFKQLHPHVRLDWTGTSSRAYTGWAVPDHDATILFMQRFRQVLDEALNRTSDPEWWEHELSFGTDSSDGPLAVGRKSEPGLHKTTSAADKSQ